MRSFKFASTISVAPFQGKIRFFYLVSLARGEKKKRASSFVAVRAARQKTDSAGEIQCILQDPFGFDVLMLRVQFVVIRN